jgi:amino acid adenylation domain-containing protein/non-ribosomal peptide synthase protein (TIGR01720 family)
LTVPVQIIYDQDNFRLESYNLTNFDTVEQQDKIETIICKCDQTQFDLEQGIVLDAIFIKLNQDKNILAIAISAFCADAVSFHNLVQEISNTYQNCLAAKSINNEPLQYADLAAWQNELLAAEEAEIGKQYWQNRTLSNSVINKLSSEKQVDSKLNFSPKLINLNLHSNLIEKIEQVAEKYHTSIATLLMACWQILLWRLTGNKNIAIATCFDNRNYEELKPVLGLLAKYIPVNIELEEDLKFSQILAQLDQEINEINQWQEYFIYQKLLLPFAFEFNSQINTYQTDNLTFTIQNLSACIERFKVKLACWHSNNSLTIQLHYDTNLLDKQDIQRLGLELKALLQSIVNNSETAINKLNILSPQERQQLLIEFNQTDTSLPPYQCLHHWFEAQVKNTPDRVAVIYEHEQLTYQELNTKADKIAHYLTSLGVKSETIVALYVERSLDIVIGIIGILKAGAAYLPLEPNLPTEALTFRLQNAQVPIVLTQKHLQEKIELCAIASNIQIVYLNSNIQNLAKNSTNKVDINLPAAKNLAYVIYTSGSTGKPKGVAVEHRQILNYLSGVLAKLKIPEAASFATVSTFAADLGNTSIFGALCTGGCLHIIAESKTTDPIALADYFTEHQIDCLKIVPSHLSALLTSSDAEKLLPRQRLILGGEAPTWELIDKVHKLVPDCQIFNHYGPTESTIGVLIHHVNFSKGDSHFPLLGRPLANTQIYVLDQHQQPVPIGVAGEIYIGGANVARGYINQPELTKEKFIQNPFKNPVGGNGHSPLQDPKLYTTGDKARYHPDGNIEFLGRIDNQIKLHGFRIELGEVETVLRQHPQVRDAAVIIRENLSNKHLVAYFVADEASLQQELPNFLTQKLPEYMLPSHFIQLKALPLTPNGKIDRDSLPLPETIKLESSAFVAPRTPVEAALTQIWAELLGKEKVSIDDNFFALGGDSIISIQAIAKANQIGLRLTPNQIFEHQTIAKLAAVTETINNLTSEQGLVTGEVPLTPIQCSFFEQNLPEPHHSNQSVLLELPKEIDLKQLEEVINHLLQYHDILRSRFVKTESAWECSISLEAHGHSTLHSYQLSEFSPTLQKQAIKEISTKVQTSLNLSEGKLIQITLFDLGHNQPNRLLIVIHHLVIDGVSWRILLEDLQTALAQSNQGKTRQLPPKTTSYQQWAKLLPEYGQTEKLNTELDYWCCESRKQIKSLPVDDQDGINTEAVAHTLSVCLSETETKALLQEVPVAYHTQVNDILLAALVKAFAQWTGESQLLVNLEGHGREDIFADIDINLSRTVGWFTTVFPVLLKIEPANSANDLIKTIKEQLRQIPNRGIGYGVLRYLNRDQTISQALAAMPQAEVCFNYLGQFDSVLADSDWFKLASESDGATRSPLGKRRYLFNINGYVIDGKLKLDWIYSSRIHQEKTVLNLAESFIQRLRDLINSRFLDVESFTPSDFPQANLNQQQLGQFLATFD